jgi:hypothetical protein
LSAPVLASSGSVEAALAAAVEAALCSVSAKCTASADDDRWSLDGSGGTADGLPQFLTTGGFERAGWSHLPPDAAHPATTGPSRQAASWASLPAGPELASALALGVRDVEPDEYAVPNGDGPSYADLVEALVGLERLKAWVEGTQARVRAGLLARRRHDLADPVAGGRHPGSSLTFDEVAAEISLAEGVSPWTGQQRLHEATALSEWHPFLAQVEAGRLPIAKAMVVVAEGAALRHEHLDREVPTQDSPDPETGLVPTQLRDDLQARLLGIDALPIRELRGKGASSPQHDVAPDGADLGVAGVSAGTHGLWDLSPGRLRSAVRREVARLDPAAMRKRAVRRVRDRNVTVRPDGEGMAVLRAWLPLADGAACAAVLDAGARAARDAGDSRTLDQLRADHLVHRLTDGVAGTEPPLTVDAPGAVAPHRSGTEPQPVGVCAPDDAAPPTDSAPLEHAAPLEHPAPLKHAARSPRGRGRFVTVIHLTIDAATALGLSEEPAQLGTGLTGPRVMASTVVESDTARDLLAQAMRRALADPSAVQLRRVLTSPTTGVATDVSRAYRPGRRLAEFLAVRDRASRFPTSDAPVRENDHIVPFDHDDPLGGGPTSAANLEATGQSDHHVRHRDGWLLEGDGNEETCWVTPAGKCYPSRPPSLAEPAPPPEPPRPPGQDHLTDPPF